MKGPIKDVMPCQSGDVLDPQPLEVQQVRRRRRGGESDLVALRARASRCGDSRFMAGMRRSEVSAAFSEPGPKLRPPPTETANRRAPPSRSGLLAGRGRTANLVVRVPPFDHPKVTRHNGGSMDRLPDVMVDDHKLTGRCFQDADGDLRGQVRERPRPPARPAVQHNAASPPR